MSSFSPADDRLHYSDGSHRWLCPGVLPTRDDEDAWSLQMHAHRDRHRAEIGLPPLAEPTVDYSQPRWRATRTASMRLREPVLPIAADR